MMPATLILSSHETAWAEHWCANRWKEKKSFISFICTVCAWSWRDRVDLSAIPQDAIERVGSFGMVPSPRWFPDAIAGVMNVILKNLPAVPLQRKCWNYDQKSNGGLVSVMVLDNPIMFHWIVALMTPKFLNYTARIPDTRRQCGKIWYE